MPFTKMSSASKMGVNTTHGRLDNFDTANGIFRVSVKGKYILCRLLLQWG